jgi:hypothetical protein
VLSQRTDEASIGIELLRDIRTIFGERDRIRSAELANKLGEMDDRPWADMPYTGKRITQAQIAKILKRYHVRPKQVRFDDIITLKGYLRDWFETAWRYIPPDPPEIAETPKQSQNSAKNAETSFGSVSENVSAKMAENGQCFGVSPPRGAPGVSP